MKKSIAIALALLFGICPCFAQHWWEADEPKEIFVKYSEYDENGNVTYTERASGFKEWREFNSFGKLQHSKNTAGDEVWYTYDSNGAHVDIHVNNAAPAVCVDFEVYCEPDRQSMYEAAALASVADAPAGETVLATHDFAEIVPYFGTNANGKYYKYPDGTLICTKRVNFGNIQSSDWTAWGAWYESTNEYDAGDWPATFAEVPTLSATQVQSGTYQGVAVAELWTDRTTTKIGKTYFYRPSAASASSVTYDFIGIGRWK